MACKYYNVTIAFADIRNSTGNSDPDLDGKVFISYTDCNGEPSSQEYTTAGTYPNAFCADDGELVVATYFSFDLENLSSRSTATAAGNCVAPTPTPSVTPTVSISPTPSTTPLYPCNCISFTNVSSSEAFVSYTLCNNQSSNLLALEPYESITLCGSYPGVVDGDVIIQILGNCVGRSCIPFSPTPTPSLSITPSFSVTPSNTPSVTPSISITPSRTPSISITPTISPSKTVPPSMTPTPTKSVSKTPSLTPLPSVSKTPSISVTPSITPSNGTSPSPTPSTSLPIVIPTIDGLCMNVQFGAAPSTTPSITPSTTPSVTPTTSVSATPSITPSNTPSITTSVTPSITPSTTPSSTDPPPPPSLTPSNTPSISISNTPSITPSRTPSKTPSITRTPSVTPSITPSRTPSITPSKTPTPTPSVSYGAIAVSECSVIYVATSPNRVYSYNSVTNVSTLLNLGTSPTIGLVQDIAHTTNKLWLYDNTGIFEYDITLSPFTSVYNRKITKPSIPGAISVINGLCAMDDTHLLSDKVTVAGNQIIKLTLNPSPNNTCTIEELFTLPFGRQVSGDIMYTTNNKIIVTTKSENSSVFHISQYTYNGTSWVLEFDKNITNSSYLPNGLATMDGGITIFNQWFNTPYTKINNLSPYNTTTGSVLNPLPAGASNVPSCCNISFQPNIFPNLPSLTPTPTPSSGFNTSCNNILYRTQTNQYYSYNFSTNASTLLNVAPNPNPTLDTSNGVPITLAHTTNKSWVYAWDTTTNATVIRESNITLSPFTSTFNRNITLPAGYKPANGLVAINDTTLVGVNLVPKPSTLTNGIKQKGYYYVVEYDISGNTAIPTVKFMLPVWTEPAGGLLYVGGSIPKVLMFARDPITGGNTSINQWVYSTGQLEVKIFTSPNGSGQPPTPNVITPSGLSIVNGNLYLMGYNIYKIDLTAPYNKTLIQSPGTQLVNSSQLSNCSNVSLVPLACGDPLLTQNYYQFLGGLPPLNSPNTVTYNGVTISATGTGLAENMWAYWYSPLSFSCPNNQYVPCQGVGLGGNPFIPGLSGANYNFSYTMNFSQAVNNIKVIMAAMNGTPGFTPIETFTFTSNGGNIVISSTNNCFSAINGNTITSNEGGVATPGGAGTFLISAQTPFTQLTVTGPGGLGGTIMGVDCSTIISANPPLSPGVSQPPPAPSLSPTPTPSLTPPVSPNVGVNTIYKYLDIL